MGARTIAQTDERLIKSRDRVRDLAEVYTARREVDAMLDLVKKEAASIDATFLEPAAGNGNFLVAILERKLATVRRQHGRNIAQRGYTADTTAEFEFLTLRALRSIYGVDIDQSNVVEARKRLRNIVAEHARACLNAPGDNLTPHVMPGSPGFRQAVTAVLRTNIMRGDTINAPDQVVIVEYEADSTALAFRRTFHTLQSMADEAAAETRVEPEGLFSVEDVTPAKPRRVVDFTHYSEIH